ncbi:MAG: NADH-quinone oxidoreductase subunit A [Nitrospinota bacterium]|nr:NADH-quinone oxidoreductase subunit A [Nitrospinota bacterium]MDH5679531.1 NADH-quinone oxidoreductase subunit A [Nitrospinota bacterium]
MFAAGTGVAVAMLGLSELLGPKLRFREKMEPFECGENQVVSPKRRFSVRFYLIAMMFIIFDIEAVFLFPWAVVFQSLGLFGFVEMMIFILVLAVGLVYVWKKGALEWE